MFVQLVDGQPVVCTLQQLKNKNPNISFPSGSVELNLEDFGIHYLHIEPEPEFDPSTQRVEVEKTPVLIDGKWTIQKKAVELSEEEKVTATESMAQYIKMKRNKIIQETDYLALSDVTMSDEMKAYRQALRDITSHDGFPWNVVWPVKP